jgi:hypothetical protein
MRIGFVSATILLLLSIQSFAANGTMKGDGSAENPFQIEDYEDLKAIGKGAYLYSSNYVLTKDIDASASKNEMCNEDGCNGFVPLGKYKDAADSIIFWGNIDGQNHTISNLNLWLPCERDVALVSYLGGSVTNLNLDHINVTGRVTESNYVATVAAKLIGSIKNVHVTNGFVQGQNYVGGIVGHGTNSFNDSAIIEDVSFQGTVKGSQRVGGIVGQLDMELWRAFVEADIIALKQDVGGIVGYLTGFVLQSRSSGSIVPGARGVNNVGGIAGYSKGQVYTSASLMDIVSYGSNFDDGIGGIVGENYKGAVYYSYALGKVEGYTNVGGVVGSDGSVIGSFAMGSVSGKRYVGGISGSYTRIQHSYAAVSVQGQSNVGGLIGSNPDTVLSSYWNTEISGIDTSAAGEALTTAQMLKWESFAGWDTAGYVINEYVRMDPCDGFALGNGWCYREKEFIRTWDIDEGKSFPYLRENPFSKKALVPIALPTVLPKWQEVPAVASLNDVEGELVGKWTGVVNLSGATDTSGMHLKDTLHYGYRIGAVVGTDTVWGTSSYVAIPNGFKISSFEELQKIGKDPAYPLLGDYELTVDIDAAGQKFEPIGDSVHIFHGTFDGKGHTIKNLVIDEPTRDFTGMFGYMESGIIENLTLENAKVVGSWVVGALIGEARDVVVRHVVSLNGDVVGEHSVGGLVGSLFSCNMDFVGTTGKVKGTENVGGIVGYMKGGSTINDAFSVNVIKGFESVGGAIGYSYGYSYGGEANVYRVYSASMLKTPKFAAGGIIGGGNSDAVDGSTCPYDSTIAGIGKKAKTTAEMMMQSTYYGYDFETIWEIQEGVSYPYFKGMDPILPGMLEDDGTVNVLAGAGTEMNPYKIYNYNDLKYIGKYEYRLDQHYKLMGNIDATRSFRENCNADSTLYKGFEPIGEFSGVFIGNNKIIAGLNINRPDEDSVGLFRALASGAKVSGIVFDTSSYFGDSYTYSSSKIKGGVRGKNYVGTVAGVDNGAEIERIYVKTDVYGMDYVGGIVGRKSYGSISLSAARDTVSGKDYVGGLVGDLRTFRYPNSIKDCYSLAAVFGEQNVGGLAGYSNTAQVENSFGAGNVVGTSDFGGLVGKEVKSEYTSAYYDSTIWLVTTTALGELRNTHQMVKQETYQGWDFKDTWKIAADTTYPYLAWLTTAYYLNKTINQRYSPDKYMDSTMMHIAGSGTESDPFIIKTYSDLKSIGLGKYKLSAVYRLGNDIDASASRNEKVSFYCMGFKPIGAIREDINGIDIQDTSRVFTGKFHGGGHSITGLYTASKYFELPVSLIDSIGETGVVDSLSLIDFEAHGASDVAAIAVMNGGTVKDVTVNGLVETYYGAGIVGVNNGTLENASFTGTIKVMENNEGYTYMVPGYALSGAVGENNGTIRNVQVDVTAKGKKHAGAGIAFKNTGKIEDVKVKAELDVRGSYVGGIVAINSGTVSACSASVNITAGSYVGGIVGDNSGVVSACNSLVNIVSTGSYVGGLAGKNSGTISACTTSVDIVSDSSYVGGLIGKDNGIIENFKVSGTVKGLDYVGGFIGDADGKRDFDSFHTDMNVTGRLYVGGLFGKTTRNVSRSYATGNVKGTSSHLSDYIWASATGGLVGYTSADIDSCYSTANVEGGSGLVGVNFGTIRNSHASGKVISGSGLVDGNLGEIRDCYADGRVINGAGLVGLNKNIGVIENCYSSAIMEDGVGLVKYNEGLINKCHAKSAVKTSGGEYSAGFVIQNSGTITDCYITGDIVGDAGFVDHNQLGGVIDRCYVTGSLHLPARGGGGFVFRNDGTIRRSFVTGDIYAETKDENMYGSWVNNIGLFYVGGFASVNNTHGIIDMCFAAGNIEGRFTHAGAFAGNNKGSISNSYSTGNLKRHAEFLADSSASTTSMLYVGSFIGENEGKVDYDYATGYFEDYDGKRPCAHYSSKGGGDDFYYNGDSCFAKESIWIGNGVSDAALHKKATFKNFDFSSVWYIKDGVSYPMLREMPNVPYVGAEILKYGKGGITAKHVLSTLLERAIVADTSYALLIMPDSASKALLDSLEKQGKKASGDYVLGYRVGVVIPGDTLWSENAEASLSLESTIGVVAQVVGARFNAAFAGRHVALRFGLPADGAVKFRLLDMQGRAVRSFDLGRLAAGDYFETLAAEGLARGRYIGVLQVNGAVMDKAMLLKK